jgi:hypothetical protein
MTFDPTPDLIVDGYAQLTSSVSSRDPEDPDDYAAAKLTVLVPVTVLLSSAQARKLAAKLANYADEVDRQNRADR